jgi:hypothetical protein
MRVAMLCCVLAACDGSARRPAVDAEAAADETGPDEPWPPPPSVDAGAVPEMSCNEHGNPRDAGNRCELPPSECLDEYYLLYYTSADCVDGACVFQREILYCGGWGCISGGCNPGFT